MNTQQLLSFPASAGSTNSQVTPLSAPSSSTANINDSYPFASHPSGIPHVQQNLQCPLPCPLQQFSSLASQPQQTPGNYNHHQIAPSTHGSHQHINQHGPPQRLSHPSPYRFGIQEQSILPGHRFHHFRQFLLGSPYLISHQSKNLSILTF